MRKIKKDIRLFSNKMAFEVSIFMGIILNAIMLLGYLYKENGIVEEMRLIYVFSTNFLELYLLYTFSFKIMKKKWKKSIKYSITIFGLIFLALVLSSVSTKCFSLLTPVHPILINHSLIFLTKDLIFAINVLLTTFLINSIDQQQKAFLENEKLISENIRIRYEVLKNQLDPHFLFNSLNTLDGLIGIEDDKAHEYVQNLSQVFRHAIGNKDILSLEEEINFTQSYAKLMKIRYGNNFQVQYNIDERYINWYIMPISIQLLVENAIKHNVISNKYPLIITIETTTNNTIKVSNAIQPKIGVEAGEGIGLANLTERYKLLFQKEISIDKTDVFSVEIPLIIQLDITKDENKPIMRNNCNNCLI